MTTSAQPITSIKTRGHRRRKFADALIKAHRENYSRPRTLLVESETPIRVVCVSDTHNKRPVVPDGDILIHAGDLTENGSFDEVQGGLTWLSSLPHRHKIFVAGNHDVLLDDAFLDKYPERRYGQEKTKDDLVWGDVTYLQDSAITIEFPRVSQGKGTRQESVDASRHLARSITIFGSPWTPRYGISAFQYPPTKTDHWEKILASLHGGADIVVTHGPPRLHLDRRDFHRAGCVYLAEEIYRTRPRLHVFGHIHAAHGREDVVLDGVESAYQEVMIGWAGWGTLAWMSVLVAVGRLRRALSLAGQGKMTTFVNAAVVGGQCNELRNDAVVVEI